MRFLLYVVAAYILAACASMGRPSGGPRDKESPVYIKSNPAPGQTNVTRDRIQIEFNENISLDNPADKVVVSPPQKLSPTLMAVGHKVNVTLRDTLLPNTTYTIDFTDAIVDLNENNPLEGFSFDFSTGETIDTLRISGMVFQAENLEPAQGMLVGVHSNLSDTAIYTLPFDRITKTNQYGQFTIRNLAPGNYRIFALNDVNRDFRWDRSEDVAFFDMTISPSATTESITDTIKTEAGEDSIVTVKATHFLPDNILLTWFNENYKPQYVAKYERPERQKLSLRFGAPADSMPRVKMLNGLRAGEFADRWSILEASATRDTLMLWVTDSMVIKQDSITIEASYLKPDSLEQMVWVSDTLQLNMRPAKVKKPSKADEERNKKRAEEMSGAVDTIAPPIELMQLKLSASGTVNLDDVISLQAAHPIVKFDSMGIRLEEYIDSSWVEISPPEFRQISDYSPLLRVADYKWTPATKYRLTVDSMAVVGAYGLYNGSLQREFTTRALEDYGTIVFNLSDLPGDAFMQLLNAQDKPEKMVPVVGGQAVFKYIMPGQYYARLIWDRNNNMRWDTGNLRDSVQPEDVYYYPKKINLKRNWDMALTWAINEIPVDQQKPDDIKKNKPKPKPGEKDDRNGRNNDDEDDEYYDESYNDAFGRDNSRNRNPFDKTRNRNRSGNINGGAQRATRQ